MAVNDPRKLVPSQQGIVKSRIRPRDAASLLIVDRSGSEQRILMGKRHMRHVFMPGKFVFPGGRTEAADGRMKAIAELSEQDSSKLLDHMAGGATPTRCRALALSAIRETYEEAGLLLGKKTGFSKVSHPDWAAFAERNVMPDLSALRYFARAITPPGPPRRFDTRFFLAFREAVADSLPEQTGPSQELEELAWLSFPEALEADIPDITRNIIREAQQVLEANPSLDPGNPVIRYGVKYGRFVREVF
jgi:8-oxo-dGTP pyrophosphatase MutT (NUDIX family)